MNPERSELEKAARAYHLELVMQLHDLEDELEALTLRRNRMKAFVEGLAYLYPELVRDFVPVGEQVDQ